MVYKLQNIAELIRGDYLLRGVTSAKDLSLAQRLRFEVFNLELRKGLTSSLESGLDVDSFDPICTHLIVEHTPSKSIVGTYRMQTGLVALLNLGYYSAKEFNLKGLESLRPEILELGRACVAKEHRNYFVLSLLWQGIAQYAKQNNARYLLGCSSINTQNPKEAAAAYTVMRKHLAPEKFYTLPNSGFECLLSIQPEYSDYKLPKLLSAYLSIGAWICGPPAIDREFKTIDFLTMLDLEVANTQNKLQRFFQ